MAQSTLHVAVGVAAGTLLAWPAVRQAWRRGERLARPIGLGLLLAYSLGLLAVLPSIMLYLGADPSWGEAWWANLFIGYPLIRRLEFPSIVLGEVMLAGLFGLHYGLILLAIQRARPRQTGSGQA